MMTLCKSEFVWKLGAKSYLHLSSSTPWGLRHSAQQGNAMRSRPPTFLKKLLDIAPFIQCLCHLLTWVLISLLLHIWRRPGLQPLFVFPSCWRTPQVSIRRLQLALSVKPSLAMARAAAQALYTQSPVPCRSCMVHCWTTAGSGFLGTLAVLLGLLWLVVVCTGAA